MKKPEDIIKYFSNSVKFLPIGRKELQHSDKIKYFRYVEDKGNWFAVMEDDLAHYQITNGDFFCTIHKDYRIGNVLAITKSSQDPFMRKHNAFKIHRIENKFAPSRKISHNVEEVVAFLEGKQ